MRWTVIAPLLLLLLCTTGCFKATFRDPAVTGAGEEHDEWRSMWAFGLAGSEPVDVKHFCGEQPAAEVRTGGNLATSLTAVGTLFIYTPRKVYVTCEGSK